MTRINLVDLLVHERLVSRRDEARKLLLGYGVRINGRPVTSFWITVNPATTPALNVQTATKQATLLLSEVSG